MRDSESSLERRYVTLRRVAEAPGSGGSDPELESAAEKFAEGFHSSMNDNFNTADVVGNIFDLVRSVNRSLDSVGRTESAEAAVRKIREASAVLGILEEEPAEYLRKRKSAGGLPDIVPEEIERFIEERNSARKEKNWKKADEIRDHLNSLGIVLEDRADGTDWKVERDREEN